LSPIPSATNFFCTLYTDRSAEQVAELYRPLGRRIRKSGWREYEVHAPFGYLLIEAYAVEPGILLARGPVADPLENAAALLEPLRRTGIRHEVECYGEDGELLGEFKYPEE